MGPSTGQPAGQPAKWCAVYVVARAPPPSSSTATARAPRRGGQPGGTTSPRRPSVAAPGSSRPKPARPAADLRVAAVVVRLAVEVHGCAGPRASLPDLARPTTTPHSPRRTTSVVGDGRDAASPMHVDCRGLDDRQPGAIYETERRIRVAELTNGSRTGSVACATAVGSLARSPAAIPAGGARAARFLLAGVVADQRHAARRWPWCRRRCALLLSKRMRHRWRRLQAGAAAYDAGRPQVLRRRRRQGPPARVGTRTGSAPRSRPPAAAAGSITTADPQLLGRASRAGRRASGMLMDPEGAMALFGCAPWSVQHARAGRRFHVRVVEAEVLGVDGRRPPCWDPLRPSASSRGSSQMRRRPAPVRAWNPGQHLRRTARRLPGGRAAAQAVTTRRGQRASLSARPSACTASRSTAWSKAFLSPASPAPTASSSRGRCSAPVRFDRARPQPFSGVLFCCRWLASRCPASGAAAYTKRRTRPSA